MKLLDMLKEPEKGKFWNAAWSLVEGCAPISPGCKNCWLAQISHRFKQGLTTHATNVGDTPQFNGHVVAHNERLDIPLRKTKPTVFAIWSDLFHENVPDAFRDRAFAVMAQASRHQFIIITKRPNVAAAYLSDLETNKRVATLAGYATEPSRETPWSKWPLSNVTILVTTENQEQFVRRESQILRIARLGWRVGLLVEPMLSMVIPSTETWRELAWVLCGPENGPGKRPFDEAWAASLQAQAADAGTPFFYKAGLLKGSRYLETP